MQYKYLTIQPDMHDASLVFRLICGTMTEV